MSISKSQATKINNRKAAHSQHPESLKLKKKGGGKGGWGDPMDDLKYINSQPIIDPNDPNYEPNLNDVAIADEQVVHQTDNQYTEFNYFQNFQSDVESLSAFKIKVEELVNDYLYEGDEEKFTKNIIDLNCPNFFNQVPKVLLWTVISSKKQEYFPPARKLLSHLRTTNTVSKIQLESAFRRLFHRLNELSILNSSAYIILVDFGEFCTERNLMDESFLNQIKKQTEFAKDPQRIIRLKNHIKSIISEYFSSGDINEAIHCISEMDTPFYTHEVVKRIISTSFDYQNRERELTSQFLAKAVGDGNDYPIPRKTAELGFIILLQRVEDLYKDVPDILELLSSFIGRGIIDEVLPPSFINNVDLLQTDMGYAVINHVKHLLSGHRHMELLLNIWGTNSLKSIKTMKKEIKNIIKEYLLSRELDEALTAIQELNVPMFHHEIIKQLIPEVADYYVAKDLAPKNVNNNIAAADIVDININIPKDIADKSIQIQLAINLISTALEHNIIAKEQINGGFKRLRDRINDYKLDCPAFEKYYNVIAEPFKDIINIKYDNDGDIDEKKQQKIDVNAKDRVIDDDIKKIVMDSKKLVIEYIKTNNILNVNITAVFEAISCRMRLCGGIIYFIKIKIGDNDNDYIHAFLLQKLNKSIQILKIDVNKTKTDLLIFTKKKKAVVNDNKVNKVNSVNKPRLGGLKDRQIDDLVRNSCQSIKDDVVNKSKTKNINIKEFKVISVKSQVVAGTNLFVKIQIDSDKFIHARIWCKLDGNIELTDIQWNKNQNDDIVYF